MQFGKWTLVRALPRGGLTYARWEMRCECGTMKAVSIHNVVTGKSNSCGCDRRTIDLRPGARVGMWTLVELADKSQSMSRWVCRCDCGVVKGVWSTALYNGSSKSCGCSKRVKIVDGTKSCSVCKQTLPVSHFYTCKGKPNAKCIECYNRVGVGYRLRTKYGIGEHAYEAMRIAANFRCEICGLHESENRLGKLCVDHCHDTGAVRGLLCHNCNAAIGHLRDDVVRMKKAISYVKRHQP